MAAAGGLPHRGFRYRELSGVTHVLHALDDGSLLVADGRPAQSNAAAPIAGLLWRYSRNAADGTTRSLFAAGFERVRAIASDGEWVYVAHGARATALRLGSSAAGERRDLLDGSPWGLQVVALSLGMDGLLYVALQSADESGSATGELWRLDMEAAGHEMLARLPAGCAAFLMDGRDELFTAGAGSKPGAEFRQVLPWIAPAELADLAERMGIMAPRAAAPAQHGLGAGRFYRAATWAAPQPGAAFLCVPGAGLVQRFDLAQRGGSAHVVAAAAFLRCAAGSNLSPVDLCFSPAGRWMYVLAADASGAGRVWRMESASSAPGSSASDGLSSGDRRSVADWIAHLGHPAWRARMRAQRALAAGGDAALAALCESLERELRDERGSLAWEAAGYSHVAAQLHALWALVGAARAAVSDGAHDSVIERAGLLLLACTSSRSAQVRRAAYRALVPWPREIAGADWTAGLRDAAGMVRLAALQALVSRNEQSAAPAMVRLLAARGSPIERLSAIAALQRVAGWSTAAQAFGRTFADPELRAELGSVFLGRGDRAAVRALGRVLNDRSTPYDLRMELFPLLLHQSRSLDAQGQRLVEELLIGALIDRAPGVRRAATLTLIELHALDAAPHVRALYRSEVDVPTRLAMLELFEAFDDREAAGLLWWTLEQAGSARALARRALEALCAIGGPALLPLTAQPDPRWLAAYLAGLDDADAAVAGACRLALERVGAESSELLADLAAAGVLGAQSLRVLQELFPQAAAFKSVADVTWQRALRMELSQSGAAESDVAGGREHGRERGCFECHRSGGPGLAADLDRPAQARTRAGLLDVLFEKGSAAQRALDGYWVELEGGRLVLGRLQRSAARPTAYAAALLIDPAGRSLTLDGADVLRSGRCRLPRGHAAAIRSLNAEGLSALLDWLVAQARD